MLLWWGVGTGAHAEASYERVLRALDDLDRDLRARGPCDHG